MEQRTLKKADRLGTLIKIGISVPFLFLNILGGGSFYEKNRYRYGQ